MKKTENKNYKNKDCKTKWFKRIYCTIMTY